jgi:nucleotide-binding universal stress UspA family protein
VPRTRIRTEVVEGESAGAIVRRARRHRADLIVMGTQGLSGAGRMFFGSTTERVLRRATVPVLAVPPTSRQARAVSGGDVLAALDLGRHTAADAAAAAAVARWLDARLVLAHVVRPTQAPQWLGSRLRGHDRTRLEQARGRLERTAAGLGTDPAPECHVLVGQPAEQIAALATDGKIGLVVVTLRAIKGWVVGIPQGTTTYRVLSSADVPVLALPARWKGGR